MPSEPQRLHLLLQPLEDRDTEVVEVEFVLPLKPRPATKPATMSTATPRESPDPMLARLTRPFRLPSLSRGLSAPAFLRSGIHPVAGIPPVPLSIFVSHVLSRSAVSP